MKAKRELKEVWEEEKSIVPIPPLLPFQAKASVTRIPFLLLPLRATPRTPEEREPVSRIDEKLVGEYPGPEADSHQREGSGPGSPFSPHFFRRNKKRETERQTDTEVARKEWPAFQKLSP